MPTIALIVTGDMEQRVLGASLQRVFPTAEFSTQKVDSFTSARVAWPPPRRAGMQANIEKFATALIAALDPGRRKPPPDFVFAVDDLELINRDQPEQVVAALRSAITAELERRQGQLNQRSFDKLQEAVKQQCSFHLLVPMCEAYFFADPQALAAAGCTKIWSLAPDCDVEQLEVTDAGFLADQSAATPAPRWAIQADLRRLHPKHYLDFLLESYRDTHQGVAALTVIDWLAILQQPEHCRFLRSLFHDLTDAMAMDATAFSGQPHPLTSAWASRDRVLRNL